jgi:hypothetical protein
MVSVCKKDTLISMETCVMIVAYGKSKKCHGYVACPLRAPDIMLSSRAFNGHAPDFINYADFLQLATNAAYLLEIVFHIQPESAIPDIIYTTQTTHEKSQRFSEIGHVH